MESDILFWALIAAVLHVLMRLHEFYQVSLYNLQLVAGLIKSLFLAHEVFTIKCVFCNVTMRMLS